MILSITFFELKITFVRFDLAPIIILGEFFKNNFESKAVTPIIYIDETKISVESFLKNF